MYVSVSITPSYAARTGWATAHAQPERNHIMTPGPSIRPHLVPVGTPLIPGKLYLRLFHGRTDPDQEMEEWGFAGPTFGPLGGYWQTYCATFRLYGEDGGELWFDTLDDMIVYDGRYYGDLELFIASTGAEG